MTAGWEKTNTPGVRGRMGKGGRPQYLATWRDHTGRQRSATFGTKKEAIAVREQARSKVRRITGGQERVPLSTAKTFDELAEHWLKIKATKKKSIKDDRSMINRHLRPALGPLALPQIRKDVLDEVYVELVGEYDEEGEECEECRRGGGDAQGLVVSLNPSQRHALHRSVVRVPTLTAETDSNRARIAHTAADRLMFKVFRTSCWVMVPRARNVSYASSNIQDGTSWGRLPFLFEASVST